MQTIAQKNTITAQESIINNAPKLHASFEVGDVAHQGDLTIVRIASLPASIKPRKSRQLADGNTQGSRHIMTRGKVYDADPAEVVTLIKSATKREVGIQYVGPVFVSPNKPTENDLSHEEHGNQGFPAGAVCAVVIQRSWDKEQGERRVQD
jgi:hypothetical protein